MSSPSARLAPALPTCVGFRPRMVLLGLILVAEALLASTFLDGDQLLAQPGWLPYFISRWGAWVARFGLLFAVLFSASFVVDTTDRDTHDTELLATPFPDWRACLAHAGFVTLFSFTSYALFGAAAALAYPTLLTLLWAVSALSVALSAALMVLAGRGWFKVLKQTRTRIAGCVVGAALACWLGVLSGQLWEPARWATFRLVEAVLHPILPSLTVHPEQFRIATGKFGVIIAAECSGLEGLGLLLVFGLIWTIAYGRDLGIARCLLLLGAGLVALYCLNVVRIASLVLIGHGGAKNIAKIGFHSQAGWIAFSSVALSLTFVARHLAERRVRPAGDTSHQLHNPAAPLLVPFLAVVAAGMIAGAASGGFEWLYGFRVLAASIAVWHYRRDLRSLRWTAPGVHAITAGVLAFALWLALEAVIVGTLRFQQPVPPELAAAPEWSRAGWLALRVIGAVVTVPFVEELAFRAYLLRRLRSLDFEQVPLERFHLGAVAVSSLIFGALHGERWIAASLAGALYAWAVTRRGAISDAVFAHALTNALIAALVLCAGVWNLW